MRPGHRLAATLPILALVTLPACNRREQPEQSRQPQQEQSQKQQDIPSAVSYEAHVSAGGLTPAGGTLRNPHKGDAKAAKAGEGLFSSMNCDGCHGGGVTGWVGPSLSDGRWRFGGADGEIFQSIYYGRPHGMPAFGGALPTDAIWMIVTYLQSLPVPAAVPTQSWEK
jgi:cytochrome c oxidase cbb3-type subunit III